MWIKKTGKVSEGFYMLGAPSNPVYLLQVGQEWALVEGGLAKYKELVLEQLQETVHDLALVKHWVITHSHYDHCGLLEFLVPHLPAVKVYASAPAIRNFRLEKYRNTIYRLNNITGSSEEEEEALGGKNRILLHQIPFSEIGEGDTITTANGAMLHILSSAGHSTCSLSVYDVQHGRLFVSDALGELVTEDVWFPLAFQSMNEFLKSLMKLSKVPAKEIALGHHGVLCASRAEGAAMQSMDSCYNIIRQIDAQLKDLQDPVLVAEKLAEAYAAPSKSFVPEKVHQASMIQLIKVLKQESFVL